MYSNVTELSYRLNSYHVYSPKMNIQKKSGKSMYKHALKIDTINRLYDVNYIIYLEFTSLPLVK